MCLLITEWISAISNAISALISALILWIAWYQIKQVKVQLKSLAESQKNSTLMTVLELESEMNNRKDSFDQCNFDIRRYGIDVESEHHTLSLPLLELLQDKCSIAKENYFNSLDRLSYCIIHKYLSDRDWKAEYREIIFNAVDNYSDCFEISSRFRNTIKLYERWKIE